MSDYLVTWELEVPNASNPRDAAEYALKIMRDPAAMATWFTVVDATGTVYKIDAEDDDLEDSCSHCDASLDDGEGFDGYCGNCADVLESHHYWDGRKYEIPALEALQEAYPQ